MSVRMMIWRVLLVFFLQATSSVALVNIKAECSRSTADLPCTEISNWHALAFYIDYHQSTGPLNLCPFDILKPESEVIVIRRGLFLRCQNEGACTIRGAGTHIVVDLDEEDSVIIQGFAFVGSDENAVHIRSDVQTGFTGLCGCRFFQNRQSPDHGVRGGAIKSEQRSGHLSLYNCTFEDNHSNYAGAVYNRANFLSVRHCTFLNNSATGPAGAIFNAKYATIYIEGCQFQGNLGGNGRAIFIKGGADGQWYDGGGNHGESNGLCEGFYDESTNTCTEFLHSPFSTPVTGTPTQSIAPSLVHSTIPSTHVPSMSRIPTLMPSLSPSSVPSRTARPSKKPAAIPTDSPSSTPSTLPTAPTLYPTEQPSFSPSPTIQPTIAASMSPSEQPTVKESTNPTSQPTSVPSAPPTQSMVPSNSLSPSANPSESHAPSSITENLCGDMLVDDSEPCVPVSSWDDVVTAIQSSEGRLVFCPFEIQKQPRTAHVINKDIEVVCQRRFPSDGKCSVEGIGTTFIIRGDSSVKLNGFEFKGSESSSVRISTDGIGAITKICYCDFHSNSRTSSKDGGALFAGDGAGDIYVAFSNFWRNDAERGGAIWSESNKLTVVDSSFFLNSAKDTGSSIYVGESTHLLLRTNRFSYNVGYQTNSNIVVKPGLVLPLDDTQGVYIDAGGNTIDGDDDCKGFFILADNHCQVFHSREADQAIVYPFLRGDLANYDEEWGLALATGLRVRQLAKVNQPVQFGSVETDEDQSKLKFHRDPDGAGVVATPDGGWVYLSNSESTTGDRTGGVFAVMFDAQGEIKGYEPRLTGSTRNCNGGLTPWRTWVSCEEYARGQCWQVDPFGEIESEVITMGGSGGNYEAFAYDDRNEYKPAFFVTEDHDRGALRRFRPIVPTPYPSASPTEEASNSPSSYPSFQPTSIPTQSSQSDTFNRRLDGTLKNETWDLLHGEGTIDYLRLVPGTNKFEWTSLLEEGRNSAEEYFPGSEGISCRDGILYFVSKKLFRLFILDLDNMTFTSESTREGLMIGNDGSFTSHGDHLMHLSSDILYFTEDGSTTPGIYGRFTSTGHYFVLLEAIANRFKHDEATGLAFSPDWKRIYFCIQEHGLLFELTREDGKPFEHDERQVSVKSHPGKDHP